MMGTSALRRVGAMILRHVYVLRRSWPRLLELAYWLTMQLVLWGFVTKFFMGHSSWVADAAGVLPDEDAGGTDPAPVVDLETLDPVSPDVVVVDPDDSGHLPDVVADSADLAAIQEALSHEAPGATPASPAAADSTATSASAFVPCQRNVRCSKPNGHAGFCKLCAVKS